MDKQQILCYLTAGTSRISHSTDMQNSERSTPTSTTLLPAFSSMCLRSTCHTQLTLNTFSRCINYCINIMYSNFIELIVYRKQNKRQPKHMNQQCQGQALIRPEQDQDYTGLFEVRMFEIFFLYPTHFSDTFLIFLSKCRL